MVSCRSKCNLFLALGVNELFDISSLFYYFSICQKVLERSSLGMTMFPQNMSFFASTATEWLDLDTFFESYSRYEVKNNWISFFGFFCCCFFYCNSHSRIIRILQVSHHILFLKAKRSFHFYFRIVWHHSFTIIPKSFL